MTNIYELFMTAILTSMITGIIFGSVIGFCLMFFQNKGRNNNNLT